MYGAGGEVGRIIEKRFRAAGGEDQHPRSDEKRDEGNLTRGRRAPVSNV